jgi:hypothetical protein
MRRNAVMQLVNLGKKAKAGGNSQLQGKNGHGGARLDGVIQKPRTFVGDARNSPLTIRT